MEVDETKIDYDICGPLPRINVVDATISNMALKATLADNSMLGLSSSPMCRPRLPHSQKMLQCEVQAWIQLAS